MNIVVTICSSPQCAYVELAVYCKFQCQICGMHSVEFLTRMVLKAQSNGNLRVKPGTNNGCWTCQNAENVKAICAIQNVRCFLLHHSTCTSYALVTLYFKYGKLLCACNRLKNVPLRLHVKFTFFTCQLNVYALQLNEIHTKACQYGEIYFLWFWTGKTHWLTEVKQGMELREEARQ